MLRVFLANAPNLFESDQLATARNYIEFMMKQSFYLLAILTSACLNPICLRSATADENASQRTVSYHRDIEPIFRANCQGCHQPAKAQGEFVMTDFAALLQAGESGEPGIVPGKPEESYLLEQIIPIDGEAAMPKKGKALSDAEIELVRTWIAQGATNDAPPSGPAYSAENPPSYVRPPVVTAIAFSPDGKWAATSGFQEVLLISTENWETQKRLVGLSERIESLSFSPDSTRLAVTGGSPGRLGEVQVWNVADGDLLLSHQVTFDSIYGGCFSPDGKLIAFGCTDNTVRAIDSFTGEQKLHQGAHDDWIRVCVFSPNGKHVVSAGRDMTVKLTEVETERFVDNITSITPGALRGGINALAMHPTREEILVGGADGVPKFYRLIRETQRRIGDDANLIRRFPAIKGRIFSVDISAAGDRFVVASTLDGQSQIQVYPYDFEGKLPDDIKAIMAKRVADRKQPEKDKVETYLTKVSPMISQVTLPESSVYAVRFTPAGDKILAGGSDGLLRVFDAASGTELAKFSPVELTKDSTADSDNWTAFKSGSGIPLDSVSAPDRNKEGALLPKSDVVGLAVEPKSIVLNSPDSYSQVVVSAKYSNGQICDVTRLAELNISNDDFSVSPMGLVRPNQSGVGQLQISFGGHQLEVPVESKLDQAYHADFVRDVNPILSRLGCNSGTCHGAQKGKNGFKLSLRGYDPVEDIRALSDDLTSRRLNTAAPDASLMLLKPIGVVPHEGGVLFSKDSVQYQSLRNWIASGAKLDLTSQKVERIEISPQKPVIALEGGWQQFRVDAIYPDGSRRDVTHEAFVESGNSEVCKSYAGGRVQAIRRGEAPVLVRYEGAYAAATVTVMGNRDGFVWSQQSGFSKIDELVAAKWERMKILPSELCEDHEFLRRIHLDLTGLPPTAEQVRGFLEDNLPSKLKRQRKINELIGSSDYVDHWTNKWADLLQVNSKFIGRDGAKAFREWITRAVEENRPYDQFARDILTASGSNRENPAASYYKILRDPDLIMENTTHLFLAIRFNCNKCHDHPFERWTQDQYYEMAAYFAQTGLKEDPASKGKRIGGTAVEGAKPLYEEVYDKTSGEITHVRTQAEVAPAFPYDCEHDAPENGSRREQLAAWITSPDNPYFAKSYVNRLWGYLTGTGLMEPLDDIRAGNPPTNPELLAWLEREFIDSGFDTEHVIRLICNSKTYQLSVASNDWNDDDSINYSHAKARRLPAEVLYDAVYRVTGAVSSIPGVAPGTRAAALPDVAVQLPDGFLNNLGRPVRESACECERSQDLQLGPVMALVSGPTIGKAISDPKCALPELASTELSEEELIREVYMRVLSREATEDEIHNVQQLAQQIDVDHKMLGETLAARESWWTEEKAKLEKQRLANLESTKSEIIARQEAIKPEREKQEKERLEKLAAAEKSLQEYASKPEGPIAKLLDKPKQLTNWFPLQASALSSTNKDALIPQADRSILAQGKADKGVYTVTYDTPLSDITGFRLETLPFKSKKSNGPGLSDNGNFVVTEIQVFASPVKEPKQQTQLKIVDAKADFSQSGFSPKQTFDGRERDQKGWAVSPRLGIPHWATFKFDKPVNLEGPVRLTFKIHQFHNAAMHRLANFRISVTTDQGDLQLGLPEEFIALRNTPAKLRKPEAVPNLVSYLEQSDGEWQKRKLAVAEAKKPIPEDGQLVALRKRQASLEQPTPDNPALVQLRADYAASQNQVQNKRLTLAQDLTWALINSPAFLFNH